jgi:hypothetical protein
VEEEMVDKTQAPTLRQVQQIQVVVEGEGEVERVKLLELVAQVL